MQESFRRILYNILSGRRKKDSTLIDSSRKQNFIQANKKPRRLVGAMCFRSCSYYGRILSLLIKHPDPGIFKFTTSLPRLLKTEKAKGSIGTLFTVIIIRALPRFIEIKCKVIVLHDQNELVGRSIAKIDRIRELGLCGRISVLPKFMHLDCPGRQS